MNDPRWTDPDDAERVDPHAHDGTSPDLHEFGPDAAEPPRSQPRAYTWVLLVLLVAVGWAAVRQPVPQVGSHTLVMDRPPEVVAPQGPLAVVYEEARPATVRIEARCRGSIGQVLGVGTGFFVSEEGRLMTAYHVVDGSGARCATSYRAVTADGDRFALELVGFDAYLDLALMQAKIDASVPFIPLAAAAPRVNSQVVAIGNSRGDFLEARAGRVTRLGVQAAQATFASGTIELTAALAPGDSGGPVLNDRGEAIGVVSYISFQPGAMSSETDPFIPPFLQGLALPQEFASYAVPALANSEVVLALESGERRDIPVIGFTWRGEDYRPGRSVVNLGSQPGPIVGQIAPGGPADIAGLRGFEVRPVLDDDGRQVGQIVEADVIVAIDGEATPGFNELVEVLRRKAVGQEVVITVQRGRETVQLMLELGARRAVFQPGG